jgi:hypothetical protein
MGHCGGRLLKTIMDLREVPDKTLSGLNAGRRDFRSPDVPN